MILASHAEFIVRQTVNYVYRCAISRASKATQIIHPLDQMWIRPSKNALRLESVDQGGGRPMGRWVFRC